MKKFTKLLGIVLILTLVMSMGTMAWADDTSTESETPAVTPTGSITINVPANTTTDTTYSVYKVFDATVNADDSTKVSYTLPSGKSLTGDMLTYFSVDSAGNVTVKDDAKDTDGNLTSGAIAAIAAFVAEDQPTTTVTAPAGATSANTGTIAYGYYYISTTTGSVVTIDTNNSTPTVQDKNTLTVVVKSAGTQYDKNSLNAIAQVGTAQDFTAQITVGNGTTKLVFSDTMTNMTYVADSLVVKSGTTTLAKDTDYTLVISEDSATITVTFLEVSTKLSSGDVITLNYQGLVASDALSVNPATNKATITTDNDNTSESETVKVYNAKFTVTKQDGDGNALEGAGFKLKNAAGKWYKLEGSVVSWVDAEADGTEIKPVKGTQANPEYSEEAAAAAKEAGTEYNIPSTISGTDAVGSFTGLANGTYTLVESTVPAGYNKAADKNFTINDNDYTATNLEQGATVVNQSGTELPSTGGIGTTIFYVVGSVLVIAAGILLITKKRMGRE